MHDTVIFLKRPVSAHLSGHNQTYIPEPTKETIQSFLYNLRERDFFFHICV